jgi:two-component system copper resistance phosphate regulon response regulator CusR
MRLLIVEDDTRVAKALERSFHEQGIQTLWASDGPEGYTLALEESFDCLLLDVTIPVMDGFTLLEKLRDQGVSTPVIFVTAKDALDDRVRGLQAGGGDYLVKPYAFSELMVRLQNLLRRGQLEPDRTWSVGDLQVETLGRQVFRQGQRLDLTTQEYALLELLMRNRGRVVSRTRIAEELWDSRFDTDPNMVDAAVRRLRRKVDDPFPVRLIQTRRNFGYVIERPHE